MLHLPPDFCRAAAEAIQAGVNLREALGEQAWAAVELTRYVTLRGPQGELGFLRVLPLEGYVLRTWPGEGCEGVPLALGRYPECADLEGAQISTGLQRGWHGGASCKTQYSAAFTRHHLMVIALLDEVKKLGLRMRVDDYGGYWEKRDMAALLANLRK